MNLQNIYLNPAGISIVEDESDYCPFEDDTDAKVYEVVCESSVVVKRGTKAECDAFVLEVEAEDYAREEAKKEMWGKHL